MAQTIKLKRSATSGAIPTTSNLALGEVAINTYDGKMYIKKDVGGTETVVEVGSGSTVYQYTDAGMVEYEYTATTNQTTFSGSDNNSATLVYETGSILVFLNGVLQDDGTDYTATNGTSVVFTSALASSDEVRIISVTSAQTLHNPTKLDTITTVNNQAAYTMQVNSNNYTPSNENALIVSINGITQEPGDSFTVSGSTITFSPALVTGDVVDYIIDFGRSFAIPDLTGDFTVDSPTFHVDSTNDAVGIGTITPGEALEVVGNIELSGEVIGDLRGPVVFKAQAGENLAKSDVVYISGISGNTTVVSKADADDAAKMPAFGVVSAAATSGNPVTIFTYGILTELDTSSYSEGDELFVSTTVGTLTNSAPTGESSKIQKIAKVTRSNATSGSIFITGAGRSNATPNLDDGDIFIGNASNQAVTAALDTSIVPENGNLYHTTERVQDVTGGQFVTNGTHTGISFAYDDANDGAIDATVSLASFDTDDLSEGSTNLYYTDARVDSRLASGSVGNIVTTGYIAGPSTFTIDPAAVGDNTGTLVVAGNLQVDGTTTTINSTTMTVDDLNITLASGAANAAAANGAGITVDGASATLTYNSTPDAWSFNKNLGIGTASPSYALHVYETPGNGAYSDTTNMVATSLFHSTEATTGSYTAIQLAANNGNSALGWWNIGTVSTSTNYDNHLVFQTRTGASTYAERMRIDSSGNVGIGTASPAVEVEVASAAPQLRLTDTDGGYCEVTNVSGNLLLQADKGNSQSSSYMRFDVDGTECMRIDDSGLVGIGENSPDSLLHLKDPTGIASIITLERNDTAIATGNGIGQIRFQHQDSGNEGLCAILRVEAGDSSGTGEFVFQSGLAGTLTEKMRIDSGGNVGIGETDPDTPLHITSTSSNQITLQADSTTIGPNIVFANNDGNLARIASAETNTLRFEVGPSNTEAMRIDSSGNVGIGSPATSGINAPLDVDKAPVFNNVVANFGEFVALSGYQRGVVNINGRVNGTDYDAGLSFVRRNAGNSNWLNSIIAQDDGGHLYFGTGGSANSASTERMRIAASGNVGIGTNSPQATIQVKNTSDNATLSSVSSSLTLNHQSGTYTNNNYYNVLGFSKANSNGTTLGASIAPVMDGIGQTSALTFGVANGGGSVAEAMRIDSGGNVGIGETNPSEKLDVSGNVKLTGQFFQSMPADFWSQGTTFIEINGMGNLTHQGSYETCLTSNGYRDNNNQWKSYAINNYTGAAQIKLNPQGHISFHTDSNKADGSSTTPTERMRIDSSGNVGIGTTSTSGVQGLLHIHSSSDDNGDGDGQVNFGDESTVIISTNATSAGSQGYYGSLFFGGQDVSSATQQVWKLAGISAYSSADLATTGSADLLFYTTNSASTPSERMRITSSGNLLVGKDVANSSVAGVQLLPEGDVGVTRDGSHALLLNRLTSDGDIALFRKDGTTVGSISAHGGAINIGNGITSLKFLPALNTIHPNGNGSGSDGLTTLGWSNNRFKDLYLSGGAYLGGTGSANHLDDYEEGTFNITLTDSNSGSDTLQMKYVKIGRVVTIEGPFRGSEGSTASTFFQLSGTADSNLTLSCSLPFTPRDSGCCISPIHRNMERRSDGLNPDQGYALPVLAWAAGNATCYLTDTQTEKAYDGATGTGGGNTWRKADTRTNVVLQFNAVYMTT